MKPMTLEQFGVTMDKLPKPVLLAVRRSNAHEANVVRDYIRADAPVTGRTRGREGPAHATKARAIRRSVRTRTGPTYADILGGGAPAAPHFRVHEFGGSVYWTRAKSSRSAHDMFGHISSAGIAERLKAKGVIGHVIPGRRRLPTVSSPLGSGKHGAGSYFFFRNVDAHIDEVQHEAAEVAAEVIRRMMSTA